MELKNMAENDVRILKLLETWSHWIDKFSSLFRKSKDF